jgi:hypothetical protein
MGCKKEFIFGVTSGMFFGIYLITGQNIDPESLAFTIGDTVNTATKTAVSNQTPTMWDQYRPLLLLASVIFSIVTILSVIKQGSVAIIVAILGFIGALFLILCTKNTNFIWISLPCLAVGAILSN